MSQALLALIPKMSTQVSTVKKSIRSQVQLDRVKSQWNLKTKTADNFYQRIRRTCKGTSSRIEHEATFSLYVSEKLAHVDKRTRSQAERMTFQHIICILDLLL